MGSNHIYVIMVLQFKSPYWYYVFNPYILIDNHNYDGNHIIGIIDLTDKRIGVRKLLV